MMYQSKCRDVSHRHSADFATHIFTRMYKSHMTCDTKLNLLPKYLLSLAFVQYNLTYEIWTKNFIPVLLQLEVIHEIVPVLFN